jgi:hypothetical protein
MGPAALVAAGATPIDAVVHIIQVSLTPVFLLSGIATLLNVFSTRLARVADQVDALMKAEGTASATEVMLMAVRLKHLQNRAIMLDVAVALASAGGASTCATVLLLFVGGTGGLAVATLLYVGFGVAIACTLAAIVAYAYEMLMASRRIRAEVEAGQKMAEPE